jgi:transcriptional regulator with XRE-family HTH domain
VDDLDFAVPPYLRYAEAVRGFRLHSQVVRDEVLRLRVEERLSLRAIVERTGLPKGTISVWLRGHPLHKDEVRKRLQEAGALSAVLRKKDRGKESILYQVVRANNLNSIQIAKVSEAVVLLRLLTHGFAPFGSIFDGDRTDWLVEIPQTGKIWKIQVKTAYNVDVGLPFVSIRYGHNRIGGARRYKEGDFDFLVGYDVFTDSCFVWSWEDVSHLKTGVTVCPEALERWDKLIGE